MPPNNTFVYRAKDITKFFRYFMKCTGELPKGGHSEVPECLHVCPMNPISRLRRRFQREGYIAVEHHHMIGHLKEKVSNSPQPLRHYWRA
jgi:hypothetical protein